MMKPIKVLVGLLFALVMMVSPVEAAHQYIWNNDDYVCWLDDTSIRSNADNTCCIFDIIMVNRRTGEYDEPSSSTTIYKAEGKYWMTILNGSAPQKEVSYYAGWWQPYGLEWLQSNGYLK